MDITEIVKSVGIYFDKYGYLTIFLASFVEISPAGWLIPGGVVLAIAGYYSASGSSMQIVPVIVFGALGAWLTFLLSYLIGNKTGMWLVDKLNQQKNAEFAHRLLAKHGSVILTTSMMASITRFWVAYIAGVEKYDFKKFTFSSFISSFTWSSVMTLIGYMVGYQSQNIDKILGITGVAGWLFLATATYFIQRSVRQEFQSLKNPTPTNNENN